VKWLPGEAADECRLLPSEAGRWGEFLRSLHVAAPADAPANPVRGVALSVRAPVVEARMQRVANLGSLNWEPIRQIWSEAVAAPMDASPTWLHGDLHPRNILVENGVLAGVVDWGDITAGDRATDLASIWMLFSDAPARRDALAAYGNPSAATVSRAKGWAVLFGVMLLATGLVDHARNARLGEVILHRVALSR
jgi:aminoglycoside phosphotransferase (APT) family kinase protein